MEGIADKPKRETFCLNKKRYQTQPSVSDNSIPSWYSSKASVWESGVLNLADETVKIHLASQFRVSIKEHCRESLSATSGIGMEWAKILFCLCLTVSNGISLNVDSSNKENGAKEENVKLNLKLSNSTKNSDEILEESPSETIRFRNPIIFRERERDASVKKNYGEVVSTKDENNQEANGAIDLNKEANEYSAVLTFTKTPTPLPEGHWQLAPEAQLYSEQNEFRHPIPIIESQSFINKPRMSSVQINYSPPGALEGREVDSRNKEYPDHYANPVGQRYPEPGNNPGRGHTVHTETTHDYGRFLPVNYKSQIEKEAEALIKQQKSQNASNADRPQLGDRENRQRASGAPGYDGYQRPVNTAFFHKGGFENAYKFPENNQNHNDQRPSYASGEYTKQQYTHEPRKPVSPNTGYSYGPRQPETPNAGDSYGPRQPVTPNALYSYDPRQPLSAEGSYGPRQPVTPGDPYRPRQLLIPGDSYRPRPPVTSGDSYRPRQPVTPNSDDSYGPRQPITSTEIYQPQYSYPSERYPPPSHESAPNAPRQYDSSTEKYGPTYTEAYKNPLPAYPETTPHSPRQYGPPAEQPPQYHNEEKKFQTSYNADLNQPTHHTEPSPKEFQAPYSNNPEVDSSLSPPDSSYYIKHSVTDIPQLNKPLAMTAEDVAEEKAYYNTFKSLMDLYKQIGFKPLNLDEIPIILPPRFAIGNPFSGKIAVSGPISTEDYTPNSKAPPYSGNTDSYSPTDQNYDHYRSPYSDSRGNSHFRHTSSERNKNSQYHEQVPFDSNRSPVVSTEHYDTPENLRPEVYNTQVESPKGTFSDDEFVIKHHSELKLTDYAPQDGVKVKGIRIKDYDSQTYFEDPSQKNVDNSGESDFSSSASLPDSPLHSHSVVRKNPYDVQNYHTAEAITTYKPRVYRQKITVEDLTPTINSEERSNSFHSNDKTSKFRSSNVIDSSRDTITDISKDNIPSDPIVSINEDPQNEYNYPLSEKSVKSPTKSQQWRSRSNKKYKIQQENSNVEMFDNDQEERSNKRRKIAHNSRKTAFQGEFTYKEPEQRSKSENDENSENRSKRNGKRSSQRSPRKHKSNSRSQRDHMRAAGSTYHWGMERHKSTDGFFQYANVPGAKAFEFGYRMGGPEHTRERHHKTKGIQSKIKVNWEDGNGDTGDHYWEFNHDSREDDTEEKKPKEKKHSEE